jgi:hypothetical protein
VARTERHAHLRQQHRQPTCVLESPAGGRRRALHDLRCVDCGYTAIPNCATDVVAVQAHRIRLHTRQALMHSIGRSMRSHTRSHTASQVAPDSARHGLHCLRCNHHWRSILSARTNGHRVLIAFIHRRAPLLCSAQCARVHCLHDRWFCTCWPPLIAQSAMGRCAALCCDGAIALSVCLVRCMLHWLKCQLTAIAALHVACGVLHGVLYVACCAAMDRSDHWAQASACLHRALIAHGLD